MNEEVLLGLLGRLRTVVAENRPVVGALVAALAADGRAFAATPEGRRWRELLERSELLPRARLLWDTLGIGGTAGVAVAGPPPSEILRILAAAAASPRLETLLAALPLLAEGA